MIKYLQELPVNCKVNFFILENYLKVVVYFTISMDGNGNNRIVKM